MLNNPHVIIAIVQTGYTRQVRYLAKLLHDFVGPLEPTQLRDQVEHLTQVGSVAFHQCPSWRVGVRFWRVVSVKQKHRFHLLLVGKVPST